MKFKLTAIVLITSIFSSQLYAQCKLDKKKDDYTNKVAINTKDITIGGIGPKFGSNKKPWDIDLSFRFKDSTISLILTHASQGWASGINKFFLKLDNDLVITRDSASGEGKYRGENYTYVYSFFTLTKDELSALSKNKIVKCKIVFRYNPNFPVYDEEVKDKKSNEVKELADCLLKELN
ncbi:MAG: hypothetical protein IPP81_20020 [Chitinophagaceae bacterium]|nr:hypothetical protein [Chitinophagaceae bacterium]